MYNLVGEDIANIFHAMFSQRARGEVSSEPNKKNLRKLREKGYYADFD
jgi:hypothetical protein